MPPALAETFLNGLCIRIFLLFHVQHASMHKCSFRWYKIVKMFSSVCSIYISCSMLLFFLLRFPLVWYFIPKRLLFYLFLEQCIKMSLCGCLHAMACWWTSVISIPFVRFSVAPIMIEVCTSTACSQSWVEHQSTLKYALFIKTKNNSRMNIKLNS